METDKKYTALMSGVLFYLREGELYMKSCYPLEIEFEYNEELHSITPVLLQDEHDTVLIDCGYPVL